jgi:hypothetical protein
MYVLQLESNLKAANQRIQQLEAELQGKRMAALVADDCLVDQTLLGPDEIGMCCGD